MMAIFLRFKLSEDDLKSKYLGDSPPSASTTDITNNIRENKANQEESESSRVLLVEEKLNVSKREVT